MGTQNITIEDDLIVEENKTKKCTRCGEYFDVSNFHKDKLRKDGLFCYCKKCDSKVKSECYKRKKEGINIIAQRVKKCPKCGETNLTKFHKNKSGDKLGLQTYCIECAKNIIAPKSYEKLKKWRSEHPEENKLKHRKRALKYRYGLTIEKYENMLKYQKNKCAICGKNEKDLKKKLFIDHCHKTKKVRGLLCEKCNSLLGFFNDDVDTIEKAIKYLEDK